MGPLILGSLANIFFYLLWIISTECEKMADEEAEKQSNGRLVERTWGCMERWLRTHWFMTGMVTEPWLDVKHSPGHNFRGEDASDGHKSLGVNIFGVTCPKSRLNRIQNLLFLNGFSHPEWALAYKIFIVISCSLQLYDSQLTTRDFESDWLDAATAGTQPKPGIHPAPNSPCWRRWQGIHLQW